MPGVTLPTLPCELQSNRIGTLGFRPWYNRMVSQPDRPVGGMEKAKWTFYRLPTSSIRFSGLIMSEISYAVSWLASINPSSREEWGADCSYALLCTYTRLYVRSEGFSPAMMNECFRLLSPVTRVPPLSLHLLVIPFLPSPAASTVASQLTPNQSIFYYRIVKPTSTTK